MLTGIGARITLPKHLDKLIRWIDDAIDYADLESYENLEEEQMVR